MLISLGVFFFSFLKLRGVLTRQIKKHRHFLIDTNRVLYTAVFKLACLKVKCLQWESAILITSVELCAFKVNFLNEQYKT